MTKLTRKSVILAKIETTYGTDSTPAVGDAILISNLSATPASLQTVDRVYYKDHLGASPQLVTGASVELSFDVELAGSGSAMTPTGYASLLKACGLAETVTSTSEQEKVAYKPVSADFDSITIHYYTDGVRQIITGARGSVSFALTPGSVPVASFNFTGKYSAPTDVNTPTATYTKFKPPLAVTNATTHFSLHGVDDLVARELRIDMGNQVSYQEYIGSDEIIITDRAPTGSVVFGLTSVEDKNWVEVAKEGTFGSLSFQLGSVAGAIIEITAQQVQLGNPTHGDSDGVRTLSLDLRLVPSTGNDELILITR